MLFLEKGREYKQDFEQPRSHLQQGESFHLAPQSSPIKHSKIRKYFIKLIFCSFRKLRILVA